MFKFIVKLIIFCIVISFGIRCYEVYQIMDMLEMYPQCQSYNARGYNYKKLSHVKSCVERMNNFRATQIQFMGYYDN